MKVVCLHDKSVIEAFLRQDTALHLYSLGDLDDFFWPYTQWYGIRDQADGQLSALALLYGTHSPPVLLALSSPTGMFALRTLLSCLLPLLPRKVYTHISEGLEEVLSLAFHLESYGIHQKMILTSTSRFSSFNHADVVPLTPENLAEVAALYAASYPDNAFDARMLETGQFFGLREDGLLVSVAGIHVYSPEYRVAAIGNVTTHPQYRNRGYGKAVTAALLRSLADRVDQIGLNVKADNYPAIHSYQQLGFEIVDTYHEIMATGC
jgi:ribosomal protein S18 acetylase RimI-like enzyme